MPAIPLTYGKGKRRKARMNARSLVKLLGLPHSSLNLSTFPLIMATPLEGLYHTAQYDLDGANRSISHLVHQCRHGLETLSRHSGSWDHRLTTIDDSRGRFGVWSNNIGALRDSESTNSLDYRLRDGGQMRKSVIQALADINESAERATSIATGVLPNRANEAYVEFPPGSTLGSSDHDHPFSPTTELDELLSSIQSSVNRLFRLSMLIRRNRPRGRLPTETGVPPHDAMLDIRHVKDKFPKVKEAEWLAERLGTAISKRRGFIYYRQEHHQRLAGQDQMEEGQDRSRRAPSTIATTYDEGSMDIDQQNINLGSLSVITGATSFATAFGSDKDGGLRVPALTRLIFHGTQLEYNSAFECPFCRTIQLVSSEREWRRHVFTDLQPYVCTFENCESGSFSTRHEWFTHELESHRKQWHCNKCQSGKFGSASSLRDHFETAHSGSFTDTQWPLILKACDRPSRKFGSSSCPLCFSWKPPESRPCDKDEFCRHLGAHLQELALTALPITIDGLVILDESDTDESSEASDGDRDALEEAQDADMATVEFSDDSDSGASVARAPTPPRSLEERGDVPSEEEQAGKADEQFSQAFQDSPQPTHNRLQQLVYQNLVQHTEPFAGNCWQSNVSIGDRMGKTLYLIGTITLAMNGIDSMKALEFGCSFEREAFHKSPTKDAYEEEVAKKTFEFFMRRQTNDPNLTDPVDINAQALAQAQGFQQGFQPMQHPVPAIQMAQQQRQQLDRQRQLQQQQEQELQQMQIDMGMASQESQDAGRMTPDQQMMDVDGAQTQRPPSFSREIAQLSPEDKVKVVELAQKMMDTGSEQVKANTRMQLSQRLSPAQRAKFESAGRDPLVWFSQNQAYQVLKANFQAGQQQQEPQQMGMGQDPPGQT